MIRGDSCVHNSYRSPLTVGRITSRIRYFHSLSVQRMYLEGLIIGPVSTKKPANLAANDAKPHIKAFLNKSTLPTRCCPNTSLPQTAPAPWKRPRKLARMKKVHGKARADNLLDIGLCTAFKILVFIDAGSNAFKWPRTYWNRVA